MEIKEYNYSEIADIYDSLEYSQDYGEVNKILEKIFQKHKIKKVLDITCGTGAQAIHFHKKGYDVTASDFSKEMISVAKKKYPKLDFKKADMRNARLGKFDAVISIFNAIGHLSKKDFEKALRNIGENLNEKGYYLFDIFNLDFMKHGFIKNEFIDAAREIDNKKFVRFNNNKFDGKRGIMHMHQKTYIQEGLQKPKIMNESWDMQIYSSNELKDILERNGFEVLKFLNVDGSKFNKDKSLFILTIARKK
jgi:ubiquinone/menaquinone biosynthesis C-methylase UbiE